MSVTVSFLTSNWNSDLHLKSNNFCNFPLCILCIHCFFPISNSFLSLLSVCLSVHLRRLWTVCLWFLKNYNNKSSIIFFFTSYLLCTFSYIVYLVLYICKKIKIYTYFQIFSLKRSEFFRSSFEICFGMQLINMA